MPRFTERVAKETSHKIEWTEGWGGTHLRGALASGA